jgi:hypothetical protein
MRYRVLRPFDDRWTAQRVPSGGFIEVEGD